MFLSLISVFCILFKIGEANVRYSDPLPRPQELKWGSSGPIEIDFPLAVEINPPSELVENAFNRMVHSITQLKWQNPMDQDVHQKQGQIAGELSKRISLVQIRLANTSETLQMGADESYEMTLSGNASVIKISASVWGCLHAFSTLRQMVQYDESSSKYFFEADAYVRDWPLYAHRGIMIDSARNFLTPEVILDQIDIMELNKMNVLHWHLVDSQSWPIALSTYPEMTKGAYSSLEVYTKEDIEYIVAYASQRGVRIIPEIDMPGHARAGYYSLNKSLLACADMWKTDHSCAYAVEPPSGQLEILLNETYKVVSNIYTEVSGFFKDHWFHVGADELQEKCYDNSTLTKEWFSDNGTRTFHDLVQHWVDHALPIFESFPNRRVIMWEDIMMSSGKANHVPKSVIMQCWASGTDCAQNLTDQGYSVIMSNSDFLYLDCGYGGWLTNDDRYTETPENYRFNHGKGGSWCGPYKTWQRIYNFNITANLTLEQLEKVLGAEAAMWGEQTDSTVLISKIWPRTAALAESLWSGNSDPETGLLRTGDMTQRILVFREFLVALGYPASPLAPKFCLQNPRGCDICTSTP